MKNYTGYITAIAFLIFVSSSNGNAHSNSITNGPGKNQHARLQERQQSIQDSDIVANNAVPTLVSRQFAFTEGPAVDAEGNVFFTDQPNDRIWKYDTDGNLSLFMEKSGRANGLFFDAKGNLIACADDQSQLWSISEDKEVKILLRDFNGRRLNGPNDLWIDPKGGIYFTDPYYQREYWTRKKPDLEQENVYYLKPGKKQAVVAAHDFARPNGIIGTPDGSALFVADINDNKTYRYRIASGGSLHDRKLFASQGSDGMTVDNQGNIYLTGNGVTVYNAQGQKIKHIPIPEPWTANVTFGGKDRDLLFITASQAIYTLKMKVRGAQ